MNLDKKTILAFLTGAFSSAAVLGVVSLVIAKTACGTPSLKLSGPTGTTAAVPKITSPVSTPQASAEPSLKKPEIGTPAIPSTSQESALFQPFLSPKPDAHSIIYPVKVGDTLTAIARKNHVTVDLLKKINGLPDDKLIPGKKLKIPTYKLSLVVDKSQNILILKGDEEILKTYVVSTGVNNSTPVGVFKVTDKLVNPTWYKAGAVVPSGSAQNVLGTRWMGITKKGYGIHGTVEPEKLGQQVTAGCVRMKNEDVEELYGFIPPGIEVTITD